jgi:hypothetical protein
VYVLSLSGCDQIKNRLINSNKNDFEYKNTVGDDTNIDPVKKENKFTDSNFEKNIPDKGPNKKAKDVQLKLIEKNSETTPNRDSFSIIGTERGKPFRNSSSKKIGTD